MKIHQKRGRKPKGGKIVQHSFDLNDVIEPSPNIILHLKCSLKDINNVSNDNITTHSCEFMLNKTIELNPQPISVSNNSLSNNVICKESEASYSDSNRSTHDKIRELEKLPFQQH